MLIIKKNTTWKAGAVTSLSDDVQVAPGVTLTIEQGASVKGNGHNITTFGSLVAGGADASRTLLSDVNLALGSERSARITFDHVIMTNGSFLAPTGYGGYGSFELLGSTFKGVDGFYLWYPTSDSRISGNVFDSSHGLSIGVSGPRVDIDHNLFVDQSTAAIENWADYSDSIYVRDNSFISKDRLAVYFPDGYNSSSLNASGNWFGTTNKSTIEKMIYDKSDSLQSGAYFEDHNIAKSAPAGTHFYVAGSDGDDSILGTAGADYMVGGSGDDRYTIDHADDIALDSDGFDSAVSSVSIDLNATGLEVVTLVGQSAISVFGSDADETVNGSVAANYLLGNGGDDLLVGDDGNDYLDGGAGRDNMIGNRGDDTFVVDSSRDQVIEYGRQGTDTVLSAVSWTLGDNVENLTLTGGKGNGGTGNALANTIIGNGGDNTLTGGDGNDRLDGGAGHDVLVGNRGDDSYTVDSTRDVVTEYGRQGTDTVLSSGSWTLGDNFENLSLIGTKGDTGTGNALGNHIAGNGGANRLFGLGGDDAVVGGAGDDTIAGGAGRDLVGGGEGKDLFAFAGGDLAGLKQDNADRVTDFVSGVDRIDLHAIDAIAGGGDDAFRFVGTAAFDGGAGELRYFTKGDAAYLQADLNGDRVGDLLIGLDHVATIEARDFLL